MTQKYYLTDHASIRLAERSTLAKEEFLSLADCCSVLAYVAGQNVHYRMIWSGKDRNCYVLVTDPGDGAIITIKNALTRSGFPCQIHDAARKPNRGHEDEIGLASITSRMVGEAVCAAGADIADAGHIIDALRRYEESAAKPRAWHYRWTLRYLCAKGEGVAAKVKVLGNTAEIRHPSDAMMAEAAGIVKAAGGWDATLSLIERDTLNEVGAWELAETPVE